MIARLNVKTGNWKHCVIFTTRWASHRPSFSVTLAGKSTGWLRRCSNVTLLYRPCTERWNRRSVMSSCANSDPDHLVSWSRPIYSLVVSTSSRFRLSSTTIYPINEKTTFTGIHLTAAALPSLTNALYWFITELVAVVVSDEKVLPSISSLKRTGVFFEILRHITTRPLKQCQWMLLISFKHSNKLAYMYVWTK